MKKMQRIKHFLLSFTLMLFCIGALTSIAFAAESTTVTGNSSSGYVVTFTDKSSWNPNSNTTSSSFFDTILLQLSGADSAKLTTDNLKRVVFNNCSYMQRLAYISNWNTHPFDIEFNGCDFSKHQIFSNIALTNSTQKIIINNCTNFYTTTGSLNEGISRATYHPISLRGNITFTNITLDGMNKFNFNGGVHAENIYLTAFNASPTANIVPGNFYISGNNNIIRNVYANELLTLPLTETYGWGQIQIGGSNNIIENINFPFRSIATTINSTVDGVTEYSTNNHISNISVFGTGNYNSQIRLGGNNTGWVFNNCKINAEFRLGIYGESGSGNTPDFTFTNGIIGPSDNQLPGSVKTINKIFLDADELNLDGTKFNYCEIVTLPSLVKNGELKGLKTGTFPGSTILNVASKYSNLNGNFRISRNNNTDYTEITDCDFEPYSFFLLNAGKITNCNFKYSLDYSAGTVNIGRKSFSSGTGEVLQSSVSNCNFCNLTLGEPDIGVTNCTVYKTLTLSDFGTYNLDLQQLNPAEIKTRSRFSTSESNCYNHLYLFISRPSFTNITRIISNTPWYNDGVDHPGVTLASLNRVVINAPSITIKNYDKVLLGDPIVVFGDISLENIKTLDSDGFYNSYYTGWNNSICYRLTDVVAFGKLKLANCKLYGKDSYEIIYHYNDDGTKDFEGYRPDQQIEWYAFDYDISRIDTIKPFGYSELYNKQFISAQLSFDSITFPRVSNKQLYAPLRDINSVDELFTKSSCFGPSSSFNSYLKSTFKTSPVTKESLGTFYIHDIDATDLQIQVYGHFKAGRFERVINKQSASYSTDVLTTLPPSNTWYAQTIYNTFTLNGTTMNDCKLCYFSANAPVTSVAYGDWVTTTKLENTICYSIVNNNGHFSAGCNGDDIKFKSGAVICASINLTSMRDSTDANGNTVSLGGISRTVIEGTANISYPGYLSEPVNIKVAESPSVSTGDGYNVISISRATQFIGGYYNAEYDYSSDKITIDWGTFPGLDLDLDLNAPTIEVLRNPASTTLPTNEVSLTIACRDPDGHDDELPLSINGGAFQATPIRNYKVTENQALTVMARDANGNVRSFVVNITNIDTNGPEIVAINQSNSNWTKDPVTISVQAIDDVKLSAKAYKYEFTPNSAISSDNDGQEVIDSSKVVTTDWTAAKTYRVPDSGTVRVCVRDVMSESLSGEAKKVHETWSDPYYIRNIDKLAPTATVTYSVAEDKKVSAQEGVTVQVSITDTLDPVTMESSGLSSNPILWNANSNGRWLRDEEYTYYENGVYSLRVRDAVGNISAEVPINITQITSSEPVIDDFSGTHVGKEYTTAPVTLRVCARDQSKDKPASMDAYLNGTFDNGLPAKPYSWDGGKTWTSIATKSVYANGEYTVMVRDALGAVKESSLIITNIDSYAPTASIYMYKAAPADWDYSVRQPEVADYVWKLRIEASDLGSGVDTIQTLWDNGTHSGDAGAIIVEIEEPGVYGVIVEDKAGNRTYAEKTITSESIGQGSGGNNGTNGAYTDIKVPADGSAGGDFSSDGKASLGDLVFTADGVYNTKEDKVYPYPPGKRGIPVNLVVTGKRNNWLTGTATLGGLTVPLTFPDAGDAYTIQATGQPQRAYAFFPIDQIKEDVKNGRIKVVVKEWDSQPTFDANGNMTNSPNLVKEGSATLYTNIAISKPTLSFTYNKVTGDLTVTGTSPVAGIDGIYVDKGDGNGYQLVDGPVNLKDVDPSATIKIKVEDKAGNVTEKEIPMSELPLNGGNGGAAGGIPSIDGTNPDGSHVATDADGNPVNSYHMSNRAADIYIIGGTTSNTNSVPDGAMFGLAG